VQSPILEIRDNKGRIIVKDNLYSIVQRLVQYWRGCGAHFRVLLDGVDVESPPRRGGQAEVKNLPADRQSS